MYVNRPQSAREDLSIRVFEESPDERMEIRFTADGARQGVSSCQEQKPAMNLAGQKDPCTKSPRDKNKEAAAEWGNRLGGSKRDRGDS
jgi:hypothetical protein